MLALAGGLSLMASRDGGRGQPGPEPVGGDGQSDQLRFYLAAEQAAILGEQATMMVCVPSLLSWRPPNLVIEETVDADLEASRPP
jgi:hypothetical protein